MTDDLAGLMIPPGVLTRDGVATIDSSDGKVYDIHISVPWSGQVKVQLPTGSIGSNQTALLLHQIDGEWTVTDATIGNGVATASATSLSPWSILKCIRTNDVSILKCLIDQGVKSLPKKVAQKIFGKTLNKVLGMCGNVLSDPFFLDSCKLDDGSLPAGSGSTGGTGTVPGTSSGGTPPSGGSSGGSSSGNGGQSSTSLAPGTGRINISPCLNLRSGPSGTSALIGCVPDNSVITIECTAQGNSVTGPYGVTTVWDRTTYNGVTGYVSDADVYTGTNSAVASAC